MADGLAAVRFVWSSARHERLRLAAALGLGTGAALSAMALAASSAWLIDRAAQRPGVLTLTAVMGTVQLLALAKAGLRYGERLATHDVAFRILGRLRVRAFAALEPLAPAGLQAMRRGDVLRRTVDDVDALQNLTIRVVPQLFVGALAAAAGVAVTAALVPVAGAVLGAGVLLAVVVLPAVARRLGARPGSARTGARTEVAAQVVSLVHGAAELVAFGHEEAARARVQAADRAVDRAGRQLAFRRGLLDAAASVATGLTVVAVLAATAAAVHGGNLPVVDVAVLPLSAMAVFEVTSGLPAAFAQLGEDAASARRLAELEHRPASSPDRPEALRCPRPHLSDGVPVVCLEGARLRYGADLPPALDGADLVLHRHERLALAGPSGAGKSSVAAALLRFWPLEGGRAELGGADVAALGGDDVRACVGLLGQDSFLFGATIADNLRLARPDATDDELWAALRVAHAEEWVRSLPAALATQVGEDGAQVSGGERQRLGLARLLLGRFDVLVLDEPTASLPAETADAVLRDVLRATAGSSVLLVTHEERHLAAVDAVIRMVDGRTDHLCRAPHAGRLPPLRG